MKSVSILFVIGITSVLGSVLAYSQDDTGMQITQQTEQAALQATQQAQQDMEEMQQEIQRQNEENNAAQQSIRDQWDREDQASASTADITCQPKFSVKAGKVQPGTKVSITCSDRNAVIYYTTNGWSPSTLSRRYSSPITINATTQLQAFAAAPHMSNSRLYSANYTVKGPAIPVYPLTLAADGVLHAKTRLHLATNSTVNSKSATVGDKINILLDQDVKVGNAVVIPKGTPIDAAITIANPSGTVGRPGDIAFAVHSLSLNGATISLRGGERLDGIDHTTRSVLMWVTLVGSVPAVMMHGGDAEIKPGMKFTVGVAADTPLIPSAPVFVNKP
jgi:type II secretory pathway pseudopilin PulG